MYYHIGIAGPVSGLSKHQLEEITEFIKEALLLNSRLQLHVWRDTGVRHPLDTDKADAMTHAGAELRQIAFERIGLSYLEFKYMSDGELKLCDTLFLCPAHAHTSLQKSRVTAVKKTADRLEKKVRIVFAWRNETNHA